MSQSESFHASTRYSSSLPIGATSCQDPSQNNSSEDQLDGNNKKVKKYFVCKNCHFPTTIDQNKFEN